MNTPIQELIIVAVVMDVVGINVFPQHLLQIVFKVSLTSDTRLDIAELSSKLACIIGLMFKIFQDLWIFLVFCFVKSSSILIFKVIFLLMSKINRILLFFSSKNIKKGARVLFMTCLHNFDFKCSNF